MAVSPAVVFRFLAEHSGLVLDVHERGEVDDAALGELLSRHVGDGGLVRRQLMELGLLVELPHAGGVFEVATPVRDFFGWLLRKQRLSSPQVVRGFLADLADLRGELEGACGRGSVSDAGLVLRDLVGVMEALRALSNANREAIVSAAQDFRTMRGELSAVARVTEIRRLWSVYVEPLNDLVRVNGVMDTVCDSLRATLEAAEYRFFSHGAVLREVQRLIPRLARLRQDLAADHHAALLEVAPLFERVQRDSRWVAGASEALRTVRAGHFAELGVNRWLSFAASRSNGLMSDSSLFSRLTALGNFKPVPPLVLPDDLEPPKLDLITWTELDDVASKHEVIPDALGFVLSTWPNHPLGSQLEAFGRLTDGRYRIVEIPDDRMERSYEVKEVTLESVPVALKGMVS